MINYDNGLSINSFNFNIIEAIKKELTKRIFPTKEAGPLLLPPAATYADTGEDKLLAITTTAREVLLTAKTVFPFVLFPSTINIDRQKLTIIHRSFFRTANTISMQIDDILNVDSQVGVFFGSIHLYSKYFVNDVKTIDYLHRGDVMKIQRLIQGYSIARRKEIDCSKIEKDQLIDMLNTVGKAAT